MYKDRKTDYRGNFKFGHTTMKRYDISFDGKNVSEQEFSVGLKMAHEELSRIASFVDSQLGFYIQHKGVRENYLVVVYWANENECFIKVFIGQIGNKKQWRESLDESFCVWDLKVIWFERESYVAHILSPSEQNVKGYLADYFEQEMIG